MKEVNTKKSETRACKYTTIQCLKGDLDRVEVAFEKGQIDRTGNWTEGMIFEHLAKGIEFAISGYPVSVPAPMRWMFTILFKKKILSGEPFPAGIKPPPKFLVKGDLQAGLPGAATSFQDGINLLRGKIQRIEDGVRLEQFDPIFGRITHDQAVRVQLSHAALHMSFLKFVQCFSGLLFKHLCDGEGDDLPESAFTYVGTLEDAKAKAAKVAANA